MKRKVLLFVGVSVAMTVALYLVFLLFDLLAGTPRENEIGAIKFAALVGVLTSAFMVFFTKFFNKSN
jgi:hypothetical protein